MPLGEPRSQMPPLVCPKKKNKNCRTIRDKMQKKKRSRKKGGRGVAGVEWLVAQSRLTLLQPYGL